MAVERASTWYGISERTAERGYQQLRNQETELGQPLLLEHRQVVVDPRSPTGLRAVWHRALADPYSMRERARLQRATSKAVRQREDKATGARQARRKRTGAKKIVRNTSTARAATTVPTT
jgi:hypothetical protein